MPAWDGLSELRHASLFHKLCLYACVSLLSNPNNLYSEYLDDLMMNMLFFQKEIALFCITLWKQTAWCVSLVPPSTAK